MLAHIRVSLANGEAIGVVEAPFPRPGDPTICDKCPGDLKGRPFKGLPIMWGLHYADGAWRGGTVLDGLTGATYRAKLTLSPDSRRLELRGYIGISLIGRTEVWTRVE